ncbi:tyrosine-type recombinase/integrase [Chromobacterium phragmitis]|uniref:Tyrosine-type recombinase/integrase n=1 Tax=Chromobacterium phragmitis TaxID=2202141 RepID=A0ABV0ISJ0_9NEIS
MAILTDTKAKSLKENDKPIAHGAVVGLCLHPSSIKGHGKWVLRFVSPVTGKRRNAGLGTYPQVSIAEAGRVGASMRAQLQQGIDPLDFKLAQEQAAAKKSLVFQEAAEQVHQELLPSWKNAKHGQQWINTLTEYVFPHIGGLPLDQISPGHIADALRSIWLAKPETAGRVKQRVHAVMAWGWAHGLCSSNPVDVVHHLLPSQPSKAVRTKHQPAMPWREIPAFVARHLDCAGNYDVTRAMLLFLILTAARSGEVRGMRWQEIDWSSSIWTIPAERMKAKLVHRVPLSTPALGILAAWRNMHDELVFPSPRSQTELSDMVLTAFLRRIKAPSDVPERIATAHGFRSSFRDWCSERGYARDLAERALAHTIQNKVEAAYHRTDLLEQRRVLMEEWGNFVISEMK